MEPLTPDDIAEVIVFAAGRRENVVLADSLIFPNHQVSIQPISLRPITNRSRRLQLSCTRSHRADYDAGWSGWSSIQEADQTLKILLRDLYTESSLAFLSMSQKILHNILALHLVNRDEIHVPSYLYIDF